MKKQLLTATFVMTLASTAAFAHHPAADIVDPEIYAMIDANVADTPHADMVLDDMGSARDDVGASMEASGETGDMASEDRRPMPMAGRDFEIDAEDAVETIGLFGDVTSALSE